MIGRSSLFLGTEQRHRGETAGVPRRRVHERQRERSQGTKAPQWPARLVQRRELIKKRLPALIRFCGDHAGFRRFVNSPNRKASMVAHVHRLTRQKEVKDDDRHAR